MRPVERIFDPLLLRKTNLPWSWVPAAAGQAPQQHLLLQRQWKMSPEKILIFEDVGVLTGMILGAWVSTKIHFLNNSLLFPLLHPSVTHLDWAKAFAPSSSFAPLPQTHNMWYSKLGCFGLVKNENINKWKTPRRPPHLWSFSWEMYLQKSAHAPNPRLPSADRITPNWVWVGQ